MGYVKRGSLIYSVSWPSVWHRITGETLAEVLCNHNGSIHVVQKAHSLGDFRLDIAFREPYHDVLVSIESVMCSRSAVIILDTLSIVQRAIRRRIMAGRLPELAQTCTRGKIFTQWAQQFLPNEILQLIMHAYLTCRRPAQIMQNEPIGPIAQLKTLKGPDLTPLH